jgi:hypothetical protein
MHLGGGVFDITEFGAIPNDELDDRAAIQAAVDAAAAAPNGGVVFVPAGEFHTSGTILLPRSSSKPIGIKGVSAQSSAIKAGQAIAAETTPVVAFAWVPGQHPTWVSVADVTIARSNPGFDFQHSQPSDSERIRHCSMSNARFHALSGGSEAVLHIVGALECSLDNVVVQGGNTGFYLVNSSHVAVVNFHTDQDHQKVNGLRISTRRAVTFASPAGSPSRRPPTTSSRSSSTALAGSRPRAA